MANESKELEALKEKLENAGQHGKFHAGKLMVGYPYNKPPAELNLSGFNILSGMTDGCHIAEVVPYYQPKDRPYRLSIPHGALHLQVKTAEDGNVMLRTAENPHGYVSVYCLFTPEAVLQALELSADYLARAYMYGKKRKGNSNTL